jgi:hypothetical protein
VVRTLDELNAPRPFAVITIRCAPGPLRRFVVDGLGRFVAPWHGAIDGRQAARR